MDPDCSIILISNSLKLQSVINFCLTREYLKNINSVLLEQKVVYHIFNRIIKLNKNLKIF